MTMKMTFADVFTVAGSRTKRTVPATTVNCTHTWGATSVKENAVTTAYVTVKSADLTNLTARTSVIQSIDSDSQYSYPTVFSKVFL